MIRIRKARRAKHRMLMSMSENIIASFDRKLSRDATPFRAPLRRRLEGERARRGGAGRGAPLTRATTSRAGSP